MVMHSHGRKLTRTRRLPRNYLIPTLKLSPVQTRAPQLDYAGNVAVGHPQSAILPPKSMYHDSLAHSLRSSRALYNIMVPSSSKDVSNPEIMIDDTASMTSPHAASRRRNGAGFDTSDVQTSEDEDEDDCDSHDVDAQNRESPVVETCSPMRSRQDSIFGAAWLDDGTGADRGKRNNSAFDQAKAKDIAAISRMTLSRDDPNASSPSRGDLSPTSGV